MINKLKHNYIFNNFNIMPKVSVIIPVYNTEKYLHKCIDSILNQSFYDFELILIDDGSTDNCPIICDEFSKTDKRIKVIHQKKQGVSSARNKGIEIATGEYIYFIDSDDFIESKLLEICLKKIENFDILVFNYNLINEKGNIYKFNKYPSNTYLTEEDKFYFLINILLNTQIGAFVWNKLYKRQIIIDNNITFNSNLTFSEDLLFNLIYLLHTSNINCINQSFYNYRKKTSSIFNIDFYEEYNIYNEIGKFYYNYCKKNNRNFYIENFSIFYYILIKFIITISENFKFRDYFKAKKLLNNVEDKEFLRHNFNKLLNNNLLVKNYGPFKAIFIKQIIKFYLHDNLINKISILFIVIFVNIKRGYILLNYLKKIK